MSDFIIIDDDPINNMICTRIIQIVYPEAKIVAFENPVEAVREMKKKYADVDMGEVILFLDINMPELNGWEVLDEFNKYPEHVKKLFRIYILSSSVDALDKQKASGNQYVAGYIPKPLSKTILQGITEPREQD